MQANVGGIDRALRVIVGLGLLSMLLFGQGDARWWGLVGVVPLLTALTRWCPAYTLFGVKTCSTSKA
jgi:Inner membrane protein YgaP-like, transmembrane domain